MSFTENLVTMASEVMDLGEMSTTFILLNQNNL